MDRAVLIRLILNIDHAIYSKFQITLKQEFDNEVPAHQTNQLIVQFPQLFGIAVANQTHPQKYYEKEDKDVDLDKNKKRFQVVYRQSAFISDAVQVRILMNILSQSRIVKV